MQKEGLNSLYTVVKDYIPKNAITKKNGNKSWVYGYNDQYDVIIISKTGQIEDVIKNINNKNSNILRTSSIDDKFKHCPDLKPPPIYLNRNSSN